MQMVMDALHLARKYADDMHLFADEARLSQAIRMLVGVQHFNLDDIKRHYDGESVPVPQPRGVDEPIRSPMSSGVAQPNDALTNPLKINSHAPSSDSDLPEPARRQRADDLNEGRDPYLGEDLAKNEETPEEVIDNSHDFEHEEHHTVD